MKKTALNLNGLSARVLKAMSVFGGVQVVGIICSIVRVKLIAIWIGPVGVGLFGLYNSAIEMLSSITQLGLRNSAVRDIALSKGSRIDIVSAVVRRWSWALGVFGSVVTLLLSPMLSRWTFGDDTHTLGFVALSVVLMLSSITGGELAIMQGLNHLQRLAKASVWGVIAGLAVSVPMFYYWGVDSVVPSVIAYSVVTAIAVYVFRERKSKSADVNLPINDVFKMGRGFISLGIYMTISSFATMAVSYIFMAYLNHVSNVEIVGYYQAGYTLVNKYVGLVFAAIAMEYYPRLTGAKDFPKRASIMVSHEMKIVLWVLLPVIVLFIASADWIVSILYSGEFKVIIPFITWAMAGMIFRAVSWCMAFVILARGDGRVYLITEISSAMVCIALNILFYEMWGLDGLGISYVVWYFIYTLIVWTVYKFKYGMTLGRKMGLLIVAAVTISFVAAIISMILRG